MKEPHMTGTQHDDLPETAEHPGPQVGTTAAGWITAGWIIAAAFTVVLILRACW